MARASAPRHRLCQVTASRSRRITWQADKQSMLSKKESNKHRSRLKICTVFSSSTETTARFSSTSMTRPTRAVPAASCDTAGAPVEAALSRESRAGSRSCVCLYTLTYTCACALVSVCQVRVHFCMPGSSVPARAPSSNPHVDSYRCMGVGACGLQLLRTCFSAHPCRMWLKSVSVVLVKHFANPGFAPQASCARSLAGHAVPALDCSPTCRERARRACVQEGVRSCDAPAPRCRRAG
eukprot:3088784-Pleurochrysis_carterae.AAC.1